MGGFSQVVEKERVCIATLTTTARRCTPTDEMRPSLMLPNHQPTTTLTTTTTNAQHLTTYLYKYLMKSANKQWKGQNLLKYYFERKKKKGNFRWLCKIELPNYWLLSHLSAHEKKKAMDLYLLLKNHKSAPFWLAFAWGLKQQKTMKNIFTQMVCQNGSTDWKKWSDAGIILVSSEKKMTITLYRKMYFL